MAEEQNATETIETPVTTETTPESTEAAAPETTTETEKTPEQVAEEKKEQKENHDARRMRKFIAEAAAAKKEAEMLREQLEKRDAVQEKPAVKPQRSQYENDEDYIENLTDWKIQQRLPEIQRQQTQQAPTVDVEWQRKIQEAQKSHPDWDDAREAAEDIVVPAHLEAALGDAVRESDRGPDILHYMWTHLDDYNRIVKMSPASAVRELGKIEARLESAVVKTKPVSSAPAPIKPPSSSKGGLTKDLNDPDIPTADFFRIRNEQIKNKNKR